MKSNTTTLKWNSTLSNVLGVAAALFAVVYLAGVKLPLITTDRAAFYSLAVIGFGMCTLTMGRTATGLGWSHPITLAGIVLGVLIMFLVLDVAAGWSLPFIADERAAFLAVAVAGLAKWGLGLFSRLELKA